MNGGYAMLSLDYLGSISVGTNYNVNTNDVSTIVNSFINKKPLLVSINIQTYKHLSFVDMFTDDVEVEIYFCLNYYDDNVRRVIKIDTTTNILTLSEVEE